MEVCLGSGYTPGTPHQGWDQDHHARVCLLFHHVQPALPTESNGGGCDEGLGSGGNKLQGLKNQDWNGSLSWVIILKGSVSFEDVASTPGRNGNSLVRLIDAYTLM